MASRYDLLGDALGFLHDARRADVLSMARGDAALAKRLEDAASMGDGGKALRTIVYDLQSGRAPARAVPEAPAPTGSRSPMPFEQRIAGDREIRKTIEEAGIPPALRAGVDAGDPEAIMAAYRGAGRRSTEDSIRELAKPADQVAAEGIAGQFDRALRPGEREAYQRMADGQSVVRRGEVSEDEYADLVTRDLAGQPFIAPARQMELPFDDAPRLSGADAPPINVADDTNLQDFIDQPMRGDGYIPDEPVVRASRTSAPPRSNRLAKGAAAAAALGGAAYWASQNRPAVEQKSAASAPMDDESPAVESGGEADLAAETSPPPAVAATADTPEPTVVQAPQDYSLQARALINRLNDMRRAAGGEVPEAPAMMQEINRLMALGNQTRRATMVAAPQDDAGRMYQQAQALIDQVNQMYRQGMTPNSPQVQRLMAQVRQLQSQGDAIRNRRAG